ncbi:hypothetical protein NKH60_18270, partial [Mesorhizobium sp. M1006]|uniref:hypothetical protein n=1 Tax=Mesorhizobium sp. M1006 TaxID=2957048 RepID=UPI0033378697
DLEPAQLRCAGLARGHRNVLTMSMLAGALRRSLVDRSRDTQKLAKGLRAALDKVAVKKS